MSGEGTKGTRGRPRKNPNELATWRAPEGWSRVVVWVSEEERKALRRVAAEADTTVAAIVRALAHGLSKGVITSDEILSHVRKGTAVMEKIPTLFERDEDFFVFDRPRTECDWVFRGEGTATEKLDGTNVRLTVRSGLVVRLEKRRNPTKQQKAKGVVDGWYVDADENDAANRHLYAALRATEVEDWPDGEHCCEAIGPSIQGNPLGLEDNVLVPFNLSAPVYTNVPRSFDAMRSYVRELESLYAPGRRAEGLVFHHPDGRRAKIKRKDFRPER